MCPPSRQPGGASLAAASVAASLPPPSPAVVASSFEPPSGTEDSAVVDPSPVVAPPSPVALSMAARMQLAPPSLEASARKRRHWPAASLTGIASSTILVFATGDREKTRQNEQRGNFTEHGAEHGIASLDVHQNTACMRVRSAVSVGRSPPRCHLRRSCARS